MKIAIYLVLLSLIVSVKDSINAALETKSASVHEALRLGNLEEAERLILQNRNLLQSTDSLGLTPLTYVTHAHTKMDEDLRLKAIEILLKHHANPNCSDDQHKLNPLICAATHSLKIVRVLITNNAKLNFLGKNNETALFGAVFNNRIDIAKELIDAGAEKNLQNEAEYTVLDQCNNFLQSGLSNFQEMKKFLESKGCLTSQQIRENKIKTNTDKAVDNSSPCSIQ